VLIFCFALLTFSEAAPSSEPREVDILALTDEMRDYLDEHVVTIHGEVPRLETLAKIVFDKDFLSLTYENDFTRTASEAFESQSANCLSFTAMFVAMARYVGLNARFQEVSLSRSWERKGSVAVLVRHLNARLRIKGHDFVMDFNPDLQDRARFASPISDERATAHYYNNRGAETYGEGLYEEAMGWFELAVETDPSMSYAWSGLGMTHHRLGDDDSAEEYLETAIQKDRKDLVAVSNLAVFYTHMGRHKDAARFERRLQYHRKRNPFWHFAQAEDAMRREAWKEALHHLKTAVRLRDKQHEFYWAISRVYFAMGHERKAKSYMGLAARYAPTELDQSRYSQKLEKMNRL